MSAIQRETNQEDSRDPDFLLFLKAAETELEL